jgi:hypothetical protein
LEENFDVAQADIDEGLQAGSGARDILKVEGKLSSSVAARFGFDGLGENFADGVEYAGIVDRVRFSRGEATPTRGFLWVSYYRFKTVFSIESMELGALLWVGIDRVEDGVEYACIEPI